MIKYIRLAGVALACASREWYTQNIMYVYILKSRSRDWHYVGFSSSIETRFLQHNNGLVRSTKFYKPFNLEFVQVVDNRKEARVLEKFLKVSFNKEALIEIINN